MVAGDSRRVEVRLVTSSAVDSKRQLLDPPPVFAGGIAEGTIDEGERLVLELGRALHRYGTPAHRLELVLGRVAADLGLEARFFVVPTAIFAAFGPLGGQRSGLVPVQAGEVDLGRLADLDEVVRSLATKELGPDQALTALRHIDAVPSSYPGLAVAGAFGLVGCAGVQIFGGGWLELVVASLLGLLLGGLSLLAGTGIGRHLLVPLVATLAAFVAHVGQVVLGPYDANIVTAAGLLVFIPGLTLTVALAELSTRNLVSGTARLTMAALLFLELGFGLVFGERLGTLIVEVNAEAVLTPLPRWTQLPAVGLAALGMVAIFRARLRDAPVIMAACGVAFFGVRFSTDHFGSLVGTWVAAASLATLANLYARHRDRPASIVLVPGILLLVPGSIGLRSIRWWLAHDPMRAVDGAQEMVGVGLALAVGILAANVVLPPRRAI